MSKGKSILSYIGDKLKITQIEKPSYQIYDKLIFEEVEDATNFKLPEIEPKILYYTNKSKRHGSRRIYLVKSKDYSAEDKLDISCITKQDVYDRTRGDTGYYHIAAVQILVKYLGNAGQDIPVRITVRDQRQLDTKKSIIGLWSSNLYTGAVYTLMELNYTISAADQHIDQALKLSVQADNQVIEGAKNLAISVKTYIQWSDAVQALRRPLMDSSGKLDPGKAIVIKSTSMDVATVPQPIPIDELTYNLDFDFSHRQSKIKVGESSNTHFVVNSSDKLRVRLKEPEHVSLGRSKRINQREFEDYLDKEEEDL